MTFDVFISHETTTGLQVAKHVKKSLKKLGLNVFVADEDITIGSHWETTINDAIKDCKYFVLILTNLALISDQIHKELDCAIELKKQVIHCRKTNVDEKSIDVTFPILSPLQRIEFNNEYELADKVIWTILEREINLRYSFGLGAFYYDIEKISEGGFSTVYKVKRKPDNKIVAISVIHRLDQPTRKMLIKSISSSLELKHKNIVELYAVRISPFFHLEMEFCDKRINEYKFPLPTNKVIKYVMGICRGLEYAHGKGIIHGDLKPENILIKNNTPKISDWGFNRTLADSGKDITRLAFTPSYAAPEQLSFSKIDIRTDLYQLGVMFYEMVTGKNPHYGLFSSDETIFIPDFIKTLTERELSDTKFVPPSAINPKAKAVEPIIRKLLEQNKENRYQSATELMNDLVLLMTEQGKE